MYKNSNSTTPRIYQFMRVRLFIFQSYPTILLSCPPPSKTLLPQRWVKLDMRWFGTVQYSTQVL